MPPAKQVGCKCISKQQTLHTNPYNALSIDLVAAEETGVKIILNKDSNTKISGAKIRISTYFALSCSASSTNQKQRGLVL